MVSKHSAHEEAGLRLLQEACFFLERHRSSSLAP
jgi:hypothetical protein